MKYKIYHIPGVKIGVSTNPKKRVQRQKYAEYEILEEHNCIDTVSDREIELQKQYGYPVDNTPYKQSYDWSSNAYKNKERKWNGRIFTKEDCKLGGYVTGKKKGDKQQRARRNNVAKLNKTQTCPYCGIVTRGAAYYRYHGEKCKKNTNLKN